MSSKTTITNTVKEAARDLGLGLAAFVGVFAVPIIIAGERSYALAKWMKNRRKK
jgi:hypothetical protein